MENIRTDNIVPLADATRRRNQKRKTYDKETARKLFVSNAIYLVNEDAVPESKLVELFGIEATRFLDMKEEYGECGCVRKFYWPNGRHFRFAHAALFFELIGWINAINVLEGVKFSRGQAIIEEYRERQEVEADQRKAQEAAERAQRKAKRAAAKAAREAAKKASAEAAGQ